MTTDGSTGRRDGFNRWVASMKTDPQPMETKPASLKTPMAKLELELDDNATHVHRIPKELIHRLREKQQEEAAPPPPAPPAPPSVAASDDDDDEHSQFSPLGVVHEDRTAVFRPPPELLARAKRLKAPAKPDVQASLPTKPPPASHAGLAQSMPAAPKVPAFEAVPAAAKGGFASVPLKAPLTSGTARAPMAASTPHAAPLTSSAVATSAAVAESSLLDFSAPLDAAALAVPPASVPEADSSAVFARREVGSGVQPLPTNEALAPSVDENDEPDTREYRLLELGLAEPAPAPMFPESPASAEPAATVAEPVSALVFEPSSVVPLVPPQLDFAGPLETPAPSDPAAEAEEPGAPTTHAPVVHGESGPASAPATSLGLRLIVFAVVAFALAAVAFWRSHH